MVTAFNEATRVRALLLLQTDSLNSRWTAHQDIARIHKKFRGIVYVSRKSAYQTGPQKTAISI